MSSQQELLAPFIERREKNLKFFEKHFPHLFSYFKDYKLKRMQLNILTDINEVNLLQNGEHLYPQGAKLYAEQEVEQFKAIYTEGRTIRSVYPSYSGHYKSPRLQHRTMDELLAKSPLRKQQFQFYKLGNFYPLVVFLGAGLGYHIEKMVLNENIHNAIVVEPDTDRFAASLYSVNWSTICDQFDLSKGRGIQFAIGGNEDEYLVWAATWNHLITQCPNFPVNVLYYNHQGRQLFDKVSDRVNKDLLVYMGTWGNYDDEIRQLDYAIHNIHLGIKELPKAFSHPSQTPYFVVGAGPSLDDRIEYIRQVKDQVILVSCGTALRTLALYNVKPDIHVELESDLSAYILLTQAADKEFLKGIKLIGPSHISPLIYKMFEESRMFYKKESATATIFGQNTGNIVEDTTPTCSNLALTLGIKMGFKRIFLFGIDCGFKDVDRHHAKGSIYYDVDSIPAPKKKDLVKIKAIDGGDAWATATYFTTKRRMENMIKHHAQDDALQVFNCSDVAEIEGTQWLKEGTFIPVVEGCQNRKSEDMDYLFQPDAQPCNLDHANASLKSAHLGLQRLTVSLKELIPEKDLNLEEFSLLCSRLNTFLERQLTPQDINVAMLVQGAIKHFLFNGITHAFGIFEEDPRNNYIAAWKDDFIAFFEKLPDHYGNVVFKEFDIETDPWIKQAIYDKEDGINKHLARFEKGMITKT